MMSLVAAIASRLWRCRWMFRRPRLAVLLTVLGVAALLALLVWLPQHATLSHSRRQVPQPTEPQRYRSPRGQARWVGKWRCS
ncbi:hypothetical protein M8494_00400 [Serratia ureilytica]